jgi:hypothetical protein
MHEANPKMILHQWAMVLCLMFLQCAIHQISFAFVGHSFALVVSRSMFRALTNSSGVSSLFSKAFPCLNMLYFFSLAIHSATQKLSFFAV